MRKICEIVLYRHSKLRPIYDAIQKKDPTIIAYIINTYYIGMYILMYVGHLELQLLH